MISLKKITHAFDGKHWVLKDLDLQISPGERLAIEGQNGAGKTTLLRILATLLLPTSGEATIDGISLKQNSQDIRKRIGWMPSSENGFFPNLTGFENLQLFYLFHSPKSTKKEFEEKLNELSHQFAFRDTLHTPFFNCSSGMKQLLGLARALLFSPRILLLDEPTRSLDHATAESFAETIQKTPSQTTVVFTSHNEALVKQIATRIITLKGGRVA